MDSKAKSLSFVELTMLVFVGLLLSWKLFRLVVPSPYLWDIHNFIIIFVAITSCSLTLKHNLYLGMSRTSFVVLLFLVVTIFRLGYFRVIDTFTICSLVFSFYFIMLDWLIKNGRQ